MPILAWSLPETGLSFGTLDFGLAAEAGAAPPMVNLGGGFGVPYFAGDVAVDVARIHYRGDRFSFAVTMDAAHE